MTKVHVALDYDDTFTLAPSLWRVIIGHMQRAGWKVYCVSARFDELGQRQELQEALPDGVEIVLCDHNPKHEVTKAQGIWIDVWIDDCPWAIVGVDPPR